MKKILGLDIGTNSIGWAMVNYDFDNEKGDILGIGSRIIPMDADLLMNFEQGLSVSKTAARRQARGTRRLKHRYKLRRKRLIDTLILLGWLPATYEVGHKLPVNLERIDEMKKVFGTGQIPEDWLVYFLRKKALSERIELEELARILYHMNQRRGFKSNRKANEENIADDEEAPTTSKPKRETFVQILNITEVKDTGETSRGKKVFELVANKEIADGLSSGKITRDTLPDWKGQEKELEVRIIRSKNDTRIEFGMHNKSDWQKLKEALQKDITESDLFIGEYFFNQILHDRNYRIKERIIDRSLFIKELKAIWEKQSEFHATLNSSEKLKVIAETLYKHNAEKQKEIEKSNLFDVIVNDIIYYQRPLKSQVSSIGACRYEKKKVILKTGKGVEYSPYLKVAPASSPQFQEFRIWKQIHSIRIFAKQKTVNGKSEADVEETNFYLNENGKTALFKFFDERSDVEINDILKFFKLKDTTHRLNFPDGTKFKGNETKHGFLKRFNSLKFEKGIEILNDPEKFFNLWHLIYSVEDSSIIEKCLKEKWDFPDNVAKVFSKIPAYTSKYAGYSTKAINKFLSLMRCGSDWTYENIDEATQKRIQKILTAEYDEDIDDRTRVKLKSFSSELDFKGLPDWLSAYVIYGKHSERTGEQVDHPDFMKSIESGELRNPIVEQIVNETIQLVRDIWQNDELGKPDEIRVEIARDLKKTAEDRKKAFENNNKNRSDKERIKAILRELKVGNPESATDIDRLRLAEDNANYVKANYENKFFKKDVEPTKAEIEKYRLWMEQNCRSPYTGDVIPLSKLFTREYDVDHIFPQGRFYDDSFGNKVIC